MLKNARFRHSDKNRANEAIALSISSLPECSKEFSQPALDSADASLCAHPCQARNDGYAQILAIIGMITTV